MSYATGQKALVDKDGKLLPTTSLQKAAEEVSQFLYKMKSNNEQLLLVAHNGHTFDQNRFLNFIHEASGSEYLDESSTFFGDSLPTSRKVFKDKCKSFKSFKLVYVYKIIFPNDIFKAHYALADTNALRKVCSESTYSDRIFKEIVSNSRQLSSIRKRALFEVREKQNEKELFQLLKLNTPSKRMENIGYFSSNLENNGVTVWCEALPIFPLIKASESKTAYGHSKYNRAVKIAEILSSEKVYFQRDQKK